MFKFKSRGTKSIKGRCFDVYWVNYTDQHGISRGKWYCEVCITKLFGK